MNKINGGKINLQKLDIDRFEKKNPDILFNICLPSNIPDGNITGHFTECSVNILINTFQLDCET